MNKIQPLNDRLSALWIVLVVAMVATPLAFQSVLAFFPGVSDHPGVLVASIAVQQGMLLILALWRLRRTGMSWESLRPYVERWSQGLQGIGWGLALLFLNGVLAQTSLGIFRLVAGTEAAADLLARERQAMDFLLDPTSSVYLGVIVFMAVVLAPIVEEVFFRGYAYPVLKQHVGRHAIWLSALFFAAAHLYVINFLPLLVLGIVLNWLYERTGSLAVPIAAHATVNGIIAAISVASPVG